MNINVTAHATMRYIQRTRPDLLINDSIWEKWKRTNKETILEAEKDLIDITTDSKHIIKANFNRHGEADYYINDTKMLTIIIKNNNIVTCYPVTFSLDAIGDKELYNVLKSNVDRLETELENMEENFKSLEVDSAFEIRGLANEMESLNKRMDILKESKKNISHKLEIERSKVSEQKAKIITTKEKMVRSKLAL